MLVASQLQGVASTSYTVVSGTCAAALSNDIKGTISVLPPPALRQSWKVARESHFQLSKAGHYKEERRSTSKAQATAKALESQETAPAESAINFVGVHHVGVLCENLERSLDFYIGVLGLQVNDQRPSDKLPFRGTFLWVGSEMIHLMELPSPDPLTGRPDHAGRDRHTCLGVVSVEPVKQALEKAGITYTMSKSGRAALFTRDPDGNGLEFTQLGSMGVSRVDGK